MLTHLWRMREKQDSAVPEPVPFPPPFQRMVAINSDVEFTTWGMQINLLRMFADYRLETAFSYWFFGDPCVTWHLFHTDLQPTEHAAAAFHLMRSGLLDTLHAFAGVRNGRGLQFNRDMISRGYRQLSDEGITTRVFSNHGTTDDIQNVGGEWVHRPGVLDYPKGDVPGTERYHLDLTVQHGVRFFWVDIDRARDPVRFPAAAGEEITNLFMSQVSRDLTPILRFRRTDTGVHPDGGNLGEAIDRVLNAEVGAYAVVYTHLGVKRDEVGRPLIASMTDLPNSLHGSLRRAADAQSGGQTLFTTTERLLNHALIKAASPWVITREGNCIHVKLATSFTYEGVHFSAGWDEYMGFTVPVTASERVVLHLGNVSRQADRWRVGSQLYAGLPWRPIDMSKAIEEAVCLAPV